MNRDSFCQIWQTLYEAARERHVRLMGKAEALLEEANEARQAADFYLRKLRELSDSEKPPEGEQKP